MEERAPCLALELNGQLSANHPILEAVGPRFIRQDQVPAVDVPLADTLYARAGRRRLS